MNVSVLWRKERMSNDVKYVYPKKTRYCRNNDCKKNINHLHRAKRYCSDECRDKNAGERHPDERMNVNKNKKTTIDPKWLHRNYGGGELDIASGHSCFYAASID